MINLYQEWDAVGWYAILVQPNRERKVMAELSRFGLYSFHPVEKKWRVRRLKRKRPGGKMMPDGRTGYYVERSILPGYVFTKFPGIPRWHLVREMPGVSGVLGHNGRPIRLTYEDLETLHELRARADQHEENEQLARRVLFKPGDPVRIDEHNALAGFVSEVMAVDASAEVAYLRDLLVLGKYLPVPLAALVSA